ncbi:Zinc finger BED domain-containing protein DAYSLEEPER [Abeliophyllum distichum]|uniref:Zinc finger BED domain-containing protein DAYSLEEPER n=1 Tax=Abeliophyllum distichum TaxID=126358 RepID=A0ABD1SZF7_9LAMI
MYEFYAEKTGRNVRRPPPPNTSSSSSNSTNPNDYWSFLILKGTQNASSSASSSSFSLFPSTNETNFRDVPLELARYFGHDMLNLLDEDERNNFDILRWWRQNERQYPIVSIIARDLLTPPVSTVASESAFSTDGRMLTDMRSRLKPDILESLMCLKDWEDAELRIQDKVSLILTEEMDELST